MFIITEKELNACPELGKLLEVRKGPEHCDPRYAFLWTDGYFNNKRFELMLTDLLENIKYKDRTKVNEIQSRIGYVFANEHLLHQAFLRRSYALENRLPGSNEQLEFIGDRVLDFCMTRILTEQFAKLDPSQSDSPFVCALNEGELTKLKANYTCKDHLIECAKTLDLERFICYGSGDTGGQDARENVLEALIGAAAIDCGYDYGILRELIVRLLDVQLDQADLILQKDYYELVNAWYQKHYGKLPVYSTEALADDCYSCTLDLRVGPGVHRMFFETAQTKKKARLIAAQKAYEYLDRHGLLRDVRELGIVPDPELAINQLQELSQKQFVEEPVYEIEREGSGWRSVCRAGDLTGSAFSKTKTGAKKQSAYSVIVSFFKSQGYYDPSWENAAGTADQE